MSQPSSSDNENYSLRKINQLAFDSEKDLSLSLGQYGATYKKNTGTLPETSGPWGAIQALVAPVVVELEDGTVNWDGSSTDAPTGVEIPLGATIFGHFTKIKVISGKILAYKMAK